MEANVKSIFIRSFQHDSPQKRYDRCGYELPFNIPFVEKEYFDDGNYEEEPRLHPRVAVLKNTNVEADIMSRTRQHGRRVHYSLQEDEDFSKYHRYQSPSPGPRERHHHPGQRQHRSRRNFRLHCMFFYKIFILCFSDERDQAHLFQERYNSNILLDMREEEDDDIFYNA